MLYVLATIPMLPSGMTCAMSMVSTLSTRLTSSHTVWVIRRRLWRKFQASRRLTWSAIAVWCSATVTTHQSSFGVWVTRRALVLTSRNVTIGLRLRTLHVPFTTSVPRVTILPILCARCMLHTIGARSTLQTILQSPLSSASMLTLWVTLWVASRSIGT